MTAVGHATVQSQRPDPYIARGMLWRTCRRLLVPVLQLDGERAYSCGPACPHADVPAVPIEQDLLLRVLVRAHFATHHPRLVTEAEVRRWQLCNPTDSRAMLRAGLVRAEVDSDGRVFPLWRHETAGQRAARSWAWLPR